MHICLDFTSFLIRAITLSAVFLFVRPVHAQGGLPSERNVLTQHIKPNAGGWFQSLGNRSMAGWMTRAPLFPDLLTLRISAKNLLTDLSANLVHLNVLAL